MPLTDAEWRGYEGELVDLFLAPDFNPKAPPSVIELLNRDSIPPQHTEAMRKVDRYAPAAAAIITISSAVVEGHGPEAVFIDQTRYRTSPVYSPIEQLTGDAGKRWRSVANPMRKDSNSPLSAYLQVFDTRTLHPHKPAGKSVFGNHITHGGDIETSGPFFEKIFNLIGGKSRDRDSRIALYRALVSVNMGRASVHISTINESTPPRETYKKIQLQETGGAPTQKIGRGERLWQGGGRPAGEVTPLLKCPALRDNNLPGEPEHRAQSPLRDAHYASINEGFERDIL